MATLVGNHMESHGTKFIWQSVPQAIERRSDGKLLVTYTRHSDGIVNSDVYDTVLYAVGKRAFSMRTTCTG